MVEKCVEEIDKLSEVVVKEELVKKELENDLMQVQLIVKESENFRNLLIVIVGGVFLFVLLFYSCYWVKC